MAKDKEDDILVLSVDDIMAENGLEMTVIDTDDEKKEKKNKCEE